MKGRSAHQGSEFRVQGSGFRVQGSGFRVQGSGFRVQDVGSGGVHEGFRRGLGFRVTARWRAREEREEFERFSLLGYRGGYSSRLRFLASRG